MTLSLKPVRYLFESFVSPVFLSEFEKQVTTCQNAELANSESGWLSSCLLWRRIRNNEVVVVVADYWIRILGRDGPDFRLRDHASYLSSSMETLVEFGLNR